MSLLYRLTKHNTTTQRSTHNKNIYIKQMSDLFIRVTVTYVEFEKVVSLIESDLQAGCVYEHKGARPHIHAYLRGYARTTQHLKNLITRHIRPMAKSDWSFKTAHDDGCITYMTKGSIDPSYVKGFTAEQMEEYKDRWKEPEGSTENTKTSSNSKYQTKLQYVVRETPSQSKKRKNELIEEMLLEIKDREVTNLAYYVDSSVVRAIIKVLNDNHIVFSRYTIRDYYDTICSRKYTEDFVQSVCTFLSPK